MHTFIPTFFGWWHHTTCYLQTSCFPLVGQRVSHKFWLHRCSWEQCVILPPIWVHVVFCCLLSVLVIIVVGLSVVGVCVFTTTISTVVLVIFTTYPVHRHFTLRDLFLHLIVVDPPSWIQKQVRVFRFFFLSSSSLRRTPWISLLDTGRGEWIDWIMDYAPPRRIGFVDMYIFWQPTTWSACFRDTLHVLRVPVPMTSWVCIMTSRSGCDFLHFASYAAFPRADFHEWFPSQWYPCCSSWLYVFI